MSSIQARIRAVNNNHPRFLPPPPPPPCLAGVEKIFPLGPRSAFEQAKINELIPQLKAEQEKGVKFVTGA